VTGIVRGLGSWALEIGNRTVKGFYRSPGKDI